jgi:pimeloyl-ACP methyl ester carboxylesterase
VNFKAIKLLIASFLLIIIPWISLGISNSSLTIRSWSQDGIPLLFIAPQKNEPVPGVLIAHGFAGSKQLMQGYAYTFARAGYGVLLWDFRGHGANSASLAFSSLEPDFNVALKAIAQQPEIDRTRLALLGHSMGSGVVMSAGVKQPQQFQATIAVSPTDADVTPQAPKNLQLQAGSWEPRFVENGKRLLQAAGGEDKGRSLVVVPNVEHITILFSHTSHQAALNWLNQAFNLPATSNYVDWRMGWYGLHLIAWLLMLQAIASQSASLTLEKVNYKKAGLGLLLAPFAGTGITFLINRVIEIHNLGGIMVGGAIALWMCLAGLGWLAVMNRFPRPTVRALIVGIGLFFLLWIALGAMGQFVWVQWWLIPRRLLLWVVLSLACLPWFLAAGIAQQDRTRTQRFLWWLGQTVALVAGLIATVLLIPKLGFIFLLIPIFPLILAMLCFAAAKVPQPWSNAIASSCLFGWAIAAAFPLAAG